MRFVTSPTSSISFGTGSVSDWAILPYVNVQKSSLRWIEDLPLASALDKRSLYTAMRSGSSFRRASYALSQREPSATSSLVSAVWLPAAIWGISGVLSPLFIAEAGNAVSEGVGGTAGRRRVDTSAIDRRVGGAVVVDGAVCSGPRTALTKSCQRGEGKFVAV